MIQWWSDRPRPPARLHGRSTSCDLDERAAPHGQKIGRREHVHWHGYGHGGRIRSGEVKQASGGLAGLKINFK